MNTPRSSQMLEFKRNGSRVEFDPPVLTSGSLLLAFRYLELAEGHCSSGQPNFRDWRTWAFLRILILHS
jgi:hypothetical protein